MRDRVWDRVPRSVIVATNWGERQEFGSRGAQAVRARSAARSLPRCGRRTRTGGKDAPSKLAAMSAPCVAGSAILKRRAIDVWPQKESRACFFSQSSVLSRQSSASPFPARSATSNRDKSRENGAPHDAERAISIAYAENRAEGSSAIAPASEIINAQQRYLGIARAASRTG